ncbi:MAG: hypothetical protein ACLQAT_29960 [Candidatus Binataceae bacterium]
MPHDLFSHRGRNFRFPKTGSAKGAPPQPEHRGDGSQEKKNEHDNQSSNCGENQQQYNFDCQAHSAPLGRLGWKSSPKAAYGIRNAQPA